MARFTLPRDVYFGKGALENLKGLKGKKAIICVGGGSMKRFGFLDRAKKYLEEAGMEIVTPSDEDYAQMREMCMPVWDTIREDCGSELFDEYTAIVKEE